MKYIQHNKPCTGIEEANATHIPLLSKWVASGPIVEEFESALQKFIKAKYVVAVNSGTAALHLSLIALGVKEGDEIILPTYTAPSLLNDISYVRGKPILIDVNEENCNINTDQIREKITPKTKAMIIPHTFGIPVDIERIKHFGIPIIEDCAQALGSYCSDKPVGTAGIISIFSFNATKIVTTGQGGLVATNNKNLYENVKDLLKYSGKKNKDIKYSYNYLFNDILASIGIAQFKKLPLFLERRRTIAKKYSEILEKKGIKYLPSISKNSSNFLRFLIRCQTEKEKNSLKEKFSTAGIETKEPILHRELLHQITEQNKKDFPVSEKLTNTLLSLPIYPCLSEKEIEQILSAMQKIL